MPNSRSEGQKNRRGAPAGRRPSTIQLGEHVRAARAIGAPDRLVADTLDVTRNVALPGGDHRAQRQELRKRLNRLAGLSGRDEAAVRACRNALDVYEKATTARLGADRAFRRSPSLETRSAYLAACLSQVEALKGYLPAQRRAEVFLIAESERTPLLAGLTTEPDWLARLDREHAHLVDQLLTLGVLLRDPEAIRKLDGLCADALARVSADRSDRVKHALKLAFEDSPAIEPLASAVAAGQVGWRTLVRELVQLAERRWAAASAEGSEIAQEVGPGPLNLTLGIETRLRQLPRRS